MANEIYNFRAAGGGAGAGVEVKETKWFTQN